MNKVKIVCILIFICSLMYAQNNIEEKFLDSISNVYIFQNYRFTNNRGITQYGNITNYANKNNITSIVSINGIETKNDYTLTLVGIGYKHHVNKKILLDFFYKTFTENTKVGVLSSVAYNSPSNLNTTFGSNREFDTMLIDFQSFGMTIDYKYNFINSLKIVVGGGILRNFSSLDLGSFGFIINRIHITGLLKAGIEYNPIQNLGLYLNVNYENSNNINFSSFSYNINPISYDFGLVLKL